MVVCVYIFSFLGSIDTTKATEALDKATDSGKEDAQGLGVGGGRDRDGFVGKVLVEQAQGPCTHQKAACMHL